MGVSKISLKRSTNSLTNLNMSQLVFGTNTDSSMIWLLTLSRVAEDSFGHARTTTEMSNQISSLKDTDL